MAFCVKCGNALQPGMKFCEKCGAPQDVAPAQPAAAAPPQQPGAMPPAAPPQMPGAMPPAASPMQQPGQYYPPQQPGYPPQQPGYGAQTAQEFQAMVAQLSMGDKIIGVAAIAMLLFGLIPVEEESIISAMFELGFFAGILVLFQPVALLGVVFARWKNMMAGPMLNAIAAGVGGIGVGILVWWVPLLSEFNADVWTAWMWGIGGIAAVVGAVMSSQEA